MKTVEEMMENSDTVTERIEHLRLQTLSDVARMAVNMVGETENTALPEKSENV